MGYQQNGYPGQPPNMMFASLPLQQQQQAQHPPPKNLSQFDPMSR
jgi:hypothetical protein